jgi:hypothetical protein
MIMADNETEIVNQLKAGTLSLDELQSTFSATGVSPVTISDLGVCYSSATGQLSGFCTVTSNNSNNPITGIGMILYAPNRSTIWTVQYTNGISTPMVMTSVGTTLYTPSDGNQAFCIVYGWTDSGSYYQATTITIGSC